MRYGLIERNILQFNGSVIYTDFRHTVLGIKVPSYFTVFVRAVRLFAIELEENINEGIVFFCIYPEFIISEMRMRKSV